MGMAHTIIVAKRDFEVRNCSQLDSPTMSAMSSRGRSSFGPVAARRSAGLCCHRPRDRARLHNPKRQLPSLAPNSAADAPLANGEAADDEHPSIEQQRRRVIVPLRSRVVDRGPGSVGRVVWLRNDRRAAYGAPRRGPCRCRGASRCASHEPRPCSRLRSSIGRRGVDLGARTPCHGPPASYSSADASVVPPGGFASAAPHPASVTTIENGIWPAASGGTSRHVIEGPQSGPGLM